jgi:hypothetical protein
MKTDVPSPTSKAERKIAVANAEAVKGRYRETEFGRRRASRLPRPLAAFVWLIQSPIVFLYRTLRRSREH